VLSEDGERLVGRGDGGGQGGPKGRDPQQEVDERHAPAAGVAPPPPDLHGPVATGAGASRGSSCMREVQVPCCSAGGRRRTRWCSWLLFSVG
jgi:hypothetical protein